MSHSDTDEAVTSNKVGMEISLSFLNGSEDGK